jgi:hypothetical protein
MDHVDVNVARILCLTLCNGILGGKGRNLEIAASKLA